MHGKPKLVRVYNKGGSLISSTEYKYNVKDDRAKAKELDNVVDVMATDGTYSKKSLGVDVDMTTDVRESVSSSSGDIFQHSRRGYIDSAHPYFLYSAYSDTDCSTQLPSYFIYICISFHIRSKSGT